MIPGVIDINHNEIYSNNLRRNSFNDLKDNQKSIILWVGNVDNFNSFKVLIDADMRFSQYEIIVITDISNPSKVVLDHPNYSIKQWNINWASYLDNENRYFMLLNHHDINDKNSIYKSEGKMILALNNYIVPIVSNSHAYLACAKRLNAEFLVFNKDIAPFDLLDKIDRKDNKFFDNFFKKSIQYIDENYSSKVIANKLLNILLK